MGPAFLFGTTFVVVKDAVVEAGPIPFLAVRFLIGAAVVWPLAIRRPAERRPGVMRAGILCGAVLCAGYIFQTVGLQYVSSSVSAFVTERHSCSCSSPSSPRSPGPSRVTTSAFWV